MSPPFSWVRENRLFCDNPNNVCRLAQNMLTFEYLLLHSPPRYYFIEAPDTVMSKNSVERLGSRDQLAGFPTEVKFLPRPAIWPSYTIPRSVYRMVSTLVTLRGTRVHIPIRTTRKDIKSTYVSSFLYLTSLCWRKNNKSFACLVYTKSPSPEVSPSNSGPKWHLSNSGSFVSLSKC